MQQQQNGQGPDLAALMGGQGLGQGQGQGQGQGPQPVTVQLTEEEAQSIANLESLGFPRQAALQAFLLCDKNEELAANFLFDNQ
jgi:UV excision repair protein RAD23